jgi:HK97 family phage major capsid protein
MDSDTVVLFGGNTEIKATAVEGEWKLRAPLVVFTNPDDPDLTGDYFDATTDFDMEFPGKSTTYFNHGMDSHFQKRRLAPAQLTKDEFGVWAESILKESDEYEAFLIEMGKAGKLGMSSGVPGHLVEREPVGKAMHITYWPLGKDASYTHTPAEPKTRNVVPLKSLIPAEEPTEAADTAPVKADKPIEPEPIKELVMDTEIEAKFTDLTAKLDSLTKTIEDAPAIKGMPAVVHTTGNDPIKAYCRYLRTGDNGALKASNNTDMNIGTAADGGDTVPTGHYAGIIARRDESMLASKLGCMPIPGVGTDVIVPIDNEDDGEFVSTAEATTFDRDAAALSHTHFSLVKYTKKVQLSIELLEDTDANLMAFIENFVGRGMAKTENANLVAAAGTSGTSNVTFAHNHTYVAGEFENVIFQHDTAYYLDDTASCAWITNPSNWAIISSLTGTNFQYVNTPQGQGGARPTLLGFPVYFSTKVTAVAASAKSLYFGNWSYMGRRNGPGITVLRDPYSSANTGQVNLFYYFRNVYGVLNSEAIVYGTHSTAAG